MWNDAWRRRSPAPPFGAAQRLIAVRSPTRQLSEQLRNLKAPFFFFFSFSLRIMPWSCSKLKVNLSIERPCSQQAGSFCFFEGALNTLCVTEQLSAQVPRSRAGCPVWLCAWPRAQDLGLGLVRDELPSCLFLCFQELNAWCFWMNRLPGDFLPC